MSDACRDTWQWKMTIPYGALGELSGCVLLFLWSLTYIIVLELIVNCAEGRCNRR